MSNILELPMNQMAGISFDCDCGRHHSLPIKYLSIGSGVLPDIAKMAGRFQGKQIFMLSDNHTFEAAGKRTLNILQDAGHNVKSFVFQTGEDILIPDEKALGRLFMELESNTGLIVAVGSGTLNDLGKYMSARTGIPYIIVCTAPSMDGYASDGAPMICDGFKISFVATLAYGIVADTDIIKKAPMHLIHAGFGDVLGKFTALADWLLAKEVCGEYYCETCADLIRAALAKVTDHVDGLKNQDEQAICSLTEALVLSGVAMGLIGVSRPASGAEHMLSHYWEMYYIAHNRFPELHGIKVGISTPVIAEMFELMGDKVPRSVMDICPSREEMERLLRRVGAPVLPTDIGLEKELFHKSLLEAYTVRKRYSILQFAVDEKRIGACADAITKRIYG